jgi:hypothetical protein
VDRQPSRAVRWIEQESDLMALALRNLIELHFWATYVSDTNDNAREFLKEANTDSNLRSPAQSVSRVSDDYSLPSAAKRISRTHEFATKSYFGKSVQNLSIRAHWF